MTALLWLLPFVLSVGAAAEEENASEDLVNGIAAYNSGDFPAPLRLLRGAADRGEPEAMVNVGYMYARGQGVPADSSAALEMYERAAKAGDAEGMNAVGYRYNFAPEPNLEMAIHWYCRAVLLGNPRAMNNVALLFYNGQGVDQDRREARDLWRQAAHRGSLNAQTNLGDDLMNNAASTDAERAGGRDMLCDAALRAYGDDERFPAPSQTSGAMMLEPKSPQPGASRLCGALLS